MYAPSEEIYGKSTQGTMLYIKFVQFAIFLPKIARVGGSLT